MNKSVILAGGKQYRVIKGEEIDVDISKDVNVGDIVSFDVLLLNQEGKISLGSPTVEGCKALCKVLATVKGPKGMAFKYKRRKGYSRKVGYRQHYIRVSVEDFKVSE